MSWWVGLPVSYLNEHLHNACWPRAFFNMSTTVLYLLQWRVIHTYRGASTVHSLFSNWAARLPSTKDDGLHHQGKWKKTNKTSHAIQATEPPETKEMVSTPPLEQAPWWDATPFDQNKPKSNGNKRKKRSHIYDLEGIPLRTTREIRRLVLSFFLSFFYFLLIVCDVSLMTLSRLAEKSFSAWICRWYVRTYPSVSYRCFNNVL